MTRALMPEPFTPPRAQTLNCALRKLRQITTSLRAPTSEPLPKDGRSTFVYITVHSSRLRRFKCSRFRTTCIFLSAENCRLFKILFQVPVGLQAKVEALRTLACLILYEHLAYFMDNIIHILWWEKSCVLHCIHYTNAFLFLIWSLVHVNNAICNIFPQTAPAENP